jgi:hypothetical protein
MTAKRDTSNAGIYDRLDSLRLEVKQDISVAVNTVAMSQGRLEKKFDELEAGRLTRAEANIQDLRISLLKSSDSQKTSQAVLSTKFVLLWGILMLALSVLGGALAARIIK